MIKYPPKIIYKGLIFYAETGNGKNRRGHYFANVYYRNKDSEIFGYISLNEGWQDMDRTYTAQDIYWSDKYDCRTVRGGASLILQQTNNYDKN